MENMELIISQIRQRLEVLYQTVDGLSGGGSSGDSYTKAQTDALLNGKVDKEAGKGLSTNDFTDYYKNLVGSTATSLGALETSFDSLFTQSNIVKAQGETFPSTYDDIFELHQPFVLNGISMYYMAGGSGFIDYAGLDHSTTTTIYVARISTSNNQLTIYDSVDVSSLKITDIYGSGTNIGTEEGVTVNLNNFTTPGRFYTANSTQSGRLSPCPYANAAGNLTVEQLCDISGGTIIQQTWKANSSDAQSQTYIRKYRRISDDNWQWSQWFRIPCAFDDYYMATASLGASTGDYPTVDLNDLKTPGVYRCTSTNALDTKIGHKPTADNIQFVLTVRGTYNSTSFRQELMPVDSSNVDKIYIRNCVGGTWTSWYVFTGTVVS